MANLVKTGGFFSIPPRDVRNGMECIRGKGGKYSSPLREMGNEATWIKNQCRLLPWKNGWQMGRPVRTGYNELSGAVSCRTFVPLPVCSCVRSRACVRGEEVIFDTRPACVDHFISLATPARRRPVEIASFFSNFASFSRAYFDILSFSFKRPSFKLLDTFPVISIRNGNCSTGSI